MKHTLCLARYSTPPPQWLLRLLKGSQCSIITFCVCFLACCVSTVIINIVSVSEPPVLFLSSCGESFAIWQQDGYKNLESYAHCQVQVWSYFSVVQHADYKQSEFISVSFVLFSVRCSVVAVVLQVIPSVGSWLYCAFYFTVSLTKYHSDKYVMHTCRFSVTHQWCWGLNSNFCPGWKSV
jgi:small-conductance mechanosensitive channel